MADRSFGVREINIVGSAGTPTISSPNNINLNGNNVAISTDLQVGRNVSVVGVNCCYFILRRWCIVLNCCFQPLDQILLNYGLLTPRLLVVVR